MRGHATSIRTLFLDALELGKIGTGANLWADGRWMARVPLSDAGEGVTPYPYILVLGQDDNERIMGERLLDWRVGVRWNTELIGFEQHTDHFGMVDEVLDALTHSQHEAHTPGSDREPDPNAGC